VSNVGVVWEIVTWHAQVVFHVMEVVCKFQ
jgi:hypothetical protein